MASVERTGGFRRWLVRRLTLALAFVLVFVAGAVAMHVGMHSGDHAHMQMLEAQVDQLQSQLTQSRADLAVAQVGSQAQGGEQQGLQDQIAKLQKALQETQAHLAFYEQLIPPGPAGAISIRAFDVRPQGDFLHYRVLLTRNAPMQAAPFQGRLRLIAHGVRDGQATDVTLTAAQAPSETTDAAAASARPDGQTATDEAAPAPQAPAAPKDPLALDFEQFQRSAGLLQAVPGLDIQTVRVEVVDGENVRATQQAPFSAAAPRH